MAGEEQSMNAMPTDLSTGVEVSLRGEIPSSTPLCVQINTQMQDSIVAKKKKYQP